MTQRSIFDNPTIPRLSAIISELALGRIQIPLFQREFEWDDERRLNLFDSIARGIPIGSLFIWQTKRDLDYFKTLGGFTLKEPADTNPHRYLLDGHQRLSTLFGALHYDNHSERAADEERRWAIYFDAHAPQGARPFMLHKRSGSPPTHWIKLSALMHPRQRWEHTTKLRASDDHDAADRIEEAANILYDYQIPLVPIISEDLDLVTDSFVRINQSGKPMKEHYMLQALTYSAFPIRERTAQLREALAEHGWGGLDEQVIINALKASLGLDVYRSGPREVVAHYKSHEQSRPDAARLGRDFNELELAFANAVKLLNNHGISGPSVLPYAYQIIAITEAYRRSAPLQNEADVIKWFWLTTYKDYFTGMTSNRIRDAIEHLCEVALGAQAPLPATMDRTISLSFKYNFQATRTKAFLLRLVAGDEAQARAFGALGNDAVHKAHPKLRSEDSPFTRVVCPAHELSALHAAIEAPAMQEAQAILERHYIPVEAARALNDDDIERFVMLRSAHLEALERAFIGSLGLTIE